MKVTDLNQIGNKTIIILHQEDRSGRREYETKAKHSFSIECNLENFIDFCIGPSTGGNS